MAKPGSWIIYPISVVGGEATLWTVPLGAGSCQHTALVSRTLVIDRDDRAMRALAIDVDSGKPLWRFAYPQD